MPYEREPHPRLRGIKVCFQMIASLIRPDREVEDQKHAQVLSASRIQAMLMAGSRTGA